MLTCGLWHCLHLGELYGFRWRRETQKAKAQTKENQADSERLQLGMLSFGGWSMMKRSVRSVRPAHKKSSLSKCCEAFHTTENRLGQSTVTGCKSAWSSCTFCAWAFASWRRFVQDNCMTECIHMMLVCLMSSSLCVSNQASKNSSLSVFQKHLFT